MCHTCYNPALNFLIFNHLGTWGVSSLLRDCVCWPAVSGVNNPFYARGRSRKNQQTKIKGSSLPLNQPEESFMESHDPGVGRASRNVWEKRGTAFFSHWKLNIQVFGDSFPTFHSEIRRGDSRVILVAARTHPRTLGFMLSVAQRVSHPAESPVQSRHLINAYSEAIW